MSKEGKRQKERIERNEVNSKERYKERRKRYAKRQIQMKRRSGKWKVINKRKR